MLKPEGWQADWTLGADGLWRDGYGTIMAVQDAVSADPIAECGVAPFNLPPDNILTPACVLHDYKSNSRAFQADHDRDEGDRDLRRDVRHIDKFYDRPLTIRERVWKALAWPVYWTVRVFGGKFWEDDKTR